MTGLRMHSAKLVVMSSNLERTRGAETKIGSFSKDDGDGRENVKKKQ